MCILQFIVCITKYRGCNELFFNATPMYIILSTILMYYIIDWMTSITPAATASAASSLCASA